MTLMLWLRGNEFPPEDASTELTKTTGKKIISGIFRGLSSLCVKLALAGFYNWKIQRINVLKNLPADVL